MTICVGSKQHSSIARLWIKVPYPSITSVGSNHEVMESGTSNDLGYEKAIQGK